MKTLQDIKKVKFNLNPLFNEIDKLPIDFKPFLKQTTSENDRFNWKKH